MLLYEFTYHKKHSKQWNFADTYKVNERTMMKALQYRLEKELRCQERWPMYASYEEDTC